MNRFINAKIAQTPLIVKTWFSDAWLRELTAESLADDIERLNSDKLAKRYQQHCVVEGVNSHKPYKTRIIKLPILGNALCGIRFRGMDLTKPFVNVAVTEKELTAQGVAEAVQILANQFSDFSPKHIRFYVACDLNLSLSDFGQGASWDRVLLANRFGALKSTATPLQSLPEPFTVTREENVDFYDDYFGFFEPLLQKNPSSRTTSVE